MAIISYPALTRRPSRMSWGYVDTTEHHISPANQVVQTAIRRGDYWKASVNYINLQGRDTDLLEAFLATLQGMVNSFLLVDYSRAIPQGPATWVTTPKMTSGASVDDTLLDTDGWTPSISGIIKAGDRVQAGNQFFACIQDASSTPAGEASILISPMVKEAIAISAPVTVHNAACHMRLDKGSVRWKKRGISMDCSFSCHESFY